MGANLPGLQQHKGNLSNSGSRAGSVSAVVQDGRDVPDGTSIKFVEQLEKDLAELGCDAKIASGGGRMGVTMDRYEVLLPPTAGIYPRWLENKYT